MGKSSCVQLVGFLSRTLEKRVSRIRFAEFLLDSDQRQLLRGDEEIHLSPKAFLLLQILVDRSPNAVAKNDLYEQLWPETFVAESNLPSLVAEVRTALHDHGRSPGFIRTVHRFGYALRAELIVCSDSKEASRPASPWSLLWKGREIPLQEGDNVLGRDPDSMISLDDPSISRQHARIRVAQQKATLEDLHSKNGTFLCGQRVSGPMTLTEGDQITLGALNLTFCGSLRKTSTITMAGQSDG